MPDPEEVLSNSSADFDSSFAYALHGEMRRLLVVTVLGTLLYPLGLDLFLSSFPLTSVGPLFGAAVGLVLALVGAAFLFGGIVAVLFKTVVDANTVAARTAGAE